MIQKNPVLYHKNGFTLVEVLVVAAIIAVLSTIGVASYQVVGRNGRDAKRKSDLASIQQALELYKSDNGKYPPAGACAYGSNCYVYSTNGNSWIPALVSTYMQNVPVDPKNNGCCPWTVGGTNYNYAYGNVTADGLGYDLVAKFENTSDSYRCGVKDYKFCGGHAGSNPCSGVAHWCTTFGGAYSDYLYQASPP